MLLSFHPCLPFCWICYQQQGSFAPRMLLRFVATMSPSEAPLAFHRSPGCSKLYGFPAPPISRRDEESFSSCLGLPARDTPSRAQQIEEVNLVDARNARSPVIDVQRTTFPMSE